MYLSGDLLKSTWEQDVSDMTQFYKDQEQNGKSSVSKFCYVCIIIVLLCLIVTGRSTNHWFAITIRLGMLCVV